MTQKELRKLNRRQLLELLLIQTRRVEELQAEIEALKAQPPQPSVPVVVPQFDSEEGQHLSGIFEAAKSAADVCMIQLRDNEAFIAQMEADATARAEAIIRDADNYRAEVEQRVRDYFQLMDELHNKKSDTE